MGGVPKAGYLVLVRVAEITNREVAAASTGQKMQVFLADFMSVTAHEGSGISRQIEKWSSLHPIKKFLRV